MCGEAEEEDRESFWKEIKVQSKESKETERREVKGQKGKTDLMSHCRKSKM